MQSFKNIILAASVLASMALAENTLTIVNQDSKSRTVVFTPQVGLPEISPVSLKGMETKAVDIPVGWIGNFYSYNEGSPNVPGMLGEASWNAWDGLTFYDVSAIVNPNDMHGVKELFPKNVAVNSDNSIKEPAETATISGCQTFPCAHAYKTWNDIQTKSTTETDLVLLIGNLPQKRRRGVRNEQS